MASQRFFQDNLDSTKVISINPSPITSGQTRTITAADFDIDLALLATQDFVTTLTNARSFKQGAQVATTANIALTGLQTIDGYTTIAGDRVLVKNQTTTSENGVYVAAAGAWVRSDDFNAAADLVNGAALYILEGTTQGDTGWLMNSAASPVVSTDPITFVQFSSTAAASSSETVAGIVELATSAETLTGTSTTLATHPAGVSSYITSLVGNSTGTANLGTFTGTTIADNATVKTALQSLETSLETVTTLTNGNILVGNGSNVATSVTPSGDVTVTNAGVFSVANSSDTVKGIVETSTDAEIAAAAVAAAGATGAQLVPHAYQVAIHSNAAGTQWARRGTALSAQSTGWSVSNLTSQKTLDCNAETLQSLADVVGSMMTELLAKGLISA